MFEVFKMRVTNWVERQSERKREGDGIVFVPSDRNVREISEAMLIEGALPSEINQVVIDVAQERERVVAGQLQTTLARQLIVIGEALTIDGATSNEIPNILSDARREIDLPTRRPLLLSYRPARRVNLADYPI